MPRRRRRGCCRRTPSRRSPRRSRMLGDPTRVRILDALSGGRAVRLRHRDAGRDQRVGRVAPAAPAAGHAAGPAAARRPAGLLLARRSAHRPAAAAGGDARSGEHRHAAADSSSMRRRCNGRLAARSARFTRSRPSGSRAWTATKRWRSSNGRLKRLAGVESLDADVMAQRLRVQHDAAVLTPARIAEVVARTGHARLAGARDRGPTLRDDRYARASRPGIRASLSPPASPRRSLRPWRHSAGCSSRWRSHSPAFIPAAARWSRIRSRVSTSTC